MNKLLLLAPLCWIAAPASQVWAQDAPLESAVTAPRVIVVGEVKEPGVLPFVPGEKATALLERAGGLGSLAAPINAHVLRDGAAIFLYPSQVRGDLYPSHMPEDSPVLTLLEGDILIMPKFSRIVSVWGNVAKPGTFTLSETKPLSALDALLAAGGILSAPEKTRIGIARAESVKWYNLREDYQELARETLQPEDVIYVPNVPLVLPKRREGRFQLLNNIR